MDFRDDFLVQNGRLVTKAEQANVGDILAIPLLREGDESTIRLYYVKQVEMNPSPPHLLPPIPIVGLARPHVGVRISEELKPIYFYVHLPMAGESCKTNWLPLEGHEGAEEWPGAKDKHEGKVYVATDELLVRLGNLIPAVEIPSWSFMLQSDNSEDLFSCIMETSLAILAARQQYHDLKIKFEDFQHMASHRQEK
jgi:hypothetical protein